MQKCLFTSLTLFSTVWLAGCATYIPRRSLTPANPGNPIKTVAVLPLVNHTNSVEGPEKVREMFAERLPERCYRFKPIQEVNQILKDELGITLGSQLDLTHPKELGEKLGVDGVIYGALFDFNEKITGVLNIRRVRGGFRLVDTHTESAVWERGEGVKSEIAMAGFMGDIASMASTISKAYDAEEGEKMKAAAAYYPGVENWHPLPPKKFSEKAGVVDTLAISLIGKVVEKAAGSFLREESQIMIERALATLPVGPGSDLCSGGATLTELGSMTENVMETKPSER